MMRRLSLDISNVDFEKLVSKSKSYSDVIRFIGLKLSGSAFYSVKSRILDLKIDISHFSGRGWSRGKILPYSHGVPLEQVLVVGSIFNRSNLKSRLLRAGLLENKCHICGMPPVWNRKPLVFRLDHINGENNDNRLENLRLLCPNCDSQSEHFTGRNIGVRFRKSTAINYKRERRIKKEVQCVSCNKKCPSGNKLYCSDLCYKRTSRKTARPSYDQLAQDIAIMPYLQIGKKYGVSDNAVRKWAKQYGLPTKSATRKLLK